MCETYNMQRRCQDEVITVPTSYEIIHNQIINKMSQRCNYNTSTKTSRIFEVYLYDVNETLTC